MFNCSLIKHVRRDYQPKKQDVVKWIKSTLLKPYTSVYVEVIIVDKSMSQKMNLEYRGKDYPTNVISLEYAESRDKFMLLQGELILCDDVIVAEAKTQNKDVFAHYAHLIIHGMLHLQGMDHIVEPDAVVMESLEIELMNKLGFANPYELCL